MYKRTILIVDDQAVNRMILGRILCDEYELLYAKNGREALETLKQRKDIISAVVLDLIMPEVSGYAVLKEMGQDKDLSMIPVIVSSQKNGAEDEIQCLSLGAQDFIAKPYKKDLIRHKLSNLIRLRENAQIINRIQVDQLTGLYNKEYFYSKIEDTIKENPDKEYDILYFGIERFKLVNDAFGNQRGDEVLKNLGELLVEAFKKEKLCARFEADDYYVFCERCEYKESQFRSWYRKVEKYSLGLELKIHCGIYQIIDDAVEVAGMCDRAKMAGDSNRGKYDESFAYYDDSLRKKLMNEQFILSSMHTALEEEQFQVYYQPKYDLNSEMIAGAEALVRWIHPEKGMISPGVFIPIFEKNGFVTELDCYVWETACKNIKEWMDRGMDPVAISVNVSRADIYNPNLLHILTDLIAKYEIPIQYLHLEITESAYAENPEQIIHTVNKFREAGFIIEMDDFGSGYSSLNMLAEMPVNVLKLDMRFIQNESEFTSGKGIISFIISLAKWLGLAVVAEGVETAEQIALLRSMDCNYVQGFYYAKPMTAEKFVELMHSVNITEMICTSRTFTEYINESVKSVENGRVMLIVDDVEINRAVLASSFIEDFSIVEKKNGLEAWEYLEEEYEQVDIIMLDLLMPVMDGFQLLARVREDDRTKDIPVIITSQRDYESEIRALEMKANDFISKPYNNSIIRNRVLNVVGNFQLQQLKSGLISEEELKNSTMKEVKAQLTVDEKIIQKMNDMKENFDVIRLVDPRETAVYEGDTCDLQSCFSVWGKDQRCNNCSSLKAYREQSRINKLEYSKDGLFFVISQYVPYGKEGAVLEMVSKIDDEYTESIFDQELLYLKLDEINNRLMQDELTGVFNRRYLDQYLEKYIDAAKRNQRDIGIAMIDIDKFKNINDTKGHIYGDQVLVRIARALEGNIAKTKGDFVSRFGGDEFVIVCKNISSDVFEERINHIVDIVYNSKSKEDENEQVSISAGCIMLSEKLSADGRELLEYADERLYCAKANKGNCVIAKGE